MLYGVKFKKLSDEQEHDYWFDNPEDRETFIKRLSNRNFIIIDYLYMQQDKLKFN